MQCMKCGREIPAGQVFCEECLLDMAKYPVKPGTVVTLPAHTKHHRERKQIFHRVTLSPEERMARMRKTIRALSWLLTLSVALLIGATILVVSMLREQGEEPLPGQNYSAEGEENHPDWNLDDPFGFPDKPEEETEEPIFDGTAEP